MSNKEANAQEPQITIEQNEQPGNASLVKFQDVLPPTLHVIALNHRPLFPGQAVPIVMGNAQWKKTLEAVSQTDHKLIGLILARNVDEDELNAKDFHRMGVVARIHRAVEQGDKIQLLVEGLQRFSVEEWLHLQKPFMVRPRYHPEPSYEGIDDLKSYVLAVINTIKELLPLNPLYGEELKVFLERFGPDNPSYMADFAAAMTTAGRDELQEVLETLPIVERLEKVLLLLTQELQQAKAQVEIRKQVEEKMQKQQREFFLREQLKAIQKELGLEKDDRTAELEKFRGRLKKLVLTEEADRRIHEEMDKLAVLEPGSPEYGVTRNYLDWLTMLPWGKHSKDKLNIKQARRILNKEHEGLEDVKERIVEFLGVGKLKGSVSGAILLLVGPPGVGKTSIGRSIATALGREFYRFSLGGIHDEAEIKGHRRTYIGAMPGKFIQAIKDAGTSNPVIMLDEIDKIGTSYRGDPSSALLEVLDPEQNIDFLDHYLDVRFDLSKALFVCTANQLDTIPGPLLDRMEVIQLSGYLSSEKLQIAKKHLLPRQIERTGLQRKDLQVTDGALKKVIEDYAREAGVRNLEKRLGAITRKAAMALLEDDEPPIKVTVDNLTDYLGKPVFNTETPWHGTGIVTGLAWTSMGGATLNIEASRVHGYNRGFKLTGQLGDVMRESAEIAYSYVLSKCEDFNIDCNFFEHSMIHLHVPAGATPKDGPSAGITMASAILSLALNKPLEKKVAMTGELTLTGQVLPVGGIREKIIAARRVGINEVILPDACRPDFEALPEYVREGVTVHFVKHYDEVQKLLFS